MRATSRWLRGSLLTGAPNLTERAETDSLPSPQPRPKAFSAASLGPQLQSGVAGDRHSNVNGKLNKKTSHSARANRIWLMGIPIDALTEQAAVERIIGNWRQGLGGWVVTPNLDQLRILYGLPELKDMVAAHATLLLADGMPLVWASKIQGTPLPRRVAGSELILSLTAAAAEAGASIFLLGGSAGAGEKAAALMVQANPGLRIAGILSPARGFEQDPEMVAAIKNRVVAAEPDLVYACLGFPKQEWVIQQLKEHLPGSWFLGLGGSLSMISGEFRRAPGWMRQGGLEWVCRLVQEPRRLFKRYIIHDAPFALRLLGSVVWHRWTAVASGESRLRATYSPPAPQRVWGILSHNGAQAADKETRERILRRYASIGIVGCRYQVTARLKQFAWSALLSGSRAVKRLLDIAGALILLILLSPILLTFALLVKVTSSGPVFFAQARVGERGRLFKMFKFRSMRQDAEEIRKELLSSNQMAGV